jgi:two-component system nitrogen regulation response regulator GlnG
MARGYALTLAYHPDATRIGERVILTTGDNPVSRSAPDFAPTEGGEARPLATPYISRRPIVVTVGDGVSVTPAEGDDGFRVDGKPGVGKVALKGSDLSAGVVLEVDELIFVLHEIMPGERLPSMGLVGRSMGTDMVRRQIARAAGHDVPVLIRGESGVGKELVARAVHDQGKRRDGAYVSVNMAAIPMTTAASSLFGHEKGAFTGADGAHAGFFGEAQGGTLFLDEIGETPTELQPTLLRALESGEIQPMGSSKPRRSDARIIAATDLALESAVDEGSFRLPLFVRLAGYEILVPPLRQRRADIPALMLFFMHQELERAGATALLSPGDDGEESWLPAEVMRRALFSEWTGNVRALRNSARRLVFDNLEEPTIAVVHGLDPSSPDEVGAESGAPTSSGSTDVSPAQLGMALEESGYRPAAAAKALGIAKTTIYELMRRHGIVTSSDLTAETITKALEAHDGDIGAAALGLKVSARALKLRMKTLGLTS